MRPADYWKRLNVECMIINEITQKLAYSFLSKFSCQRHGGAAQTFVQLVIKHATRIGKGI